MLTKRTVILAKVETTYGTDPTPTEGDNAIMAFDPTLTIVGDMKERYPGNDDISRHPEIRGKTYVEIKFSTEIKGSGAAGTAPKAGPLFKACGLEETISAGTSVTYTPRSSGFESCTIYAFIDGIKHIITGCIGDVDIDMSAGEVGMLNWTIRGIYALPTDVAVASPTFETTTPVIVKNTTYTFGSYAAICEKLTMKMNNTIAERPDFNQAEGLKGFAITGRNPEGSMTVEAVLRAESDADFFSYFHSGTVKALSMVLGATAGNILTLTAPKCYLRPPAYGDREGLRTYEIPFQCARSSGDDEVSLVYT